MPEVRLPNNWAPRPYQLALWRHFESGGKRGVAVWDPKKRTPPSPGGACSISEHARRGLSLPGTREDFFLLVACEGSTGGPLNCLGYDSFSRIHDNASWTYPWEGGG